MCMGPDGVERYADEELEFVSEFWGIFRMSTCELLHRYADDLEEIAAGDCGEHAAYRTGSNLLHAIDAGAFYNHKPLRDLADRYDGDASGFPEKGCVTQLDRDNLRAAKERAIENKSKKLLFAIKALPTLCPEKYDETFCQEYWEANEVLAIAEAIRREADKFDESYSFEGKVGPIHRLDNIGRKLARGQRANTEDGCGGNHDPGDPVIKTKEIAALASCDRTKVWRAMQGHGLPNAIQPAKCCGRASWTARMSDVDWWLDHGQPIQPIK